MTNNSSQLRYKHYYLGLDISTAKTGYSILNENGKAIECGIIETQDINTTQQFGHYMRDCFREIANRYKSETEEDEWVVGAEEFLLKFRDHSTANTISKLANCNTLACYECSNELPVKKLLKVNVNSARSFFNIKKMTGKKAKIDVKINVFNNMKHLLPSSYKIKTDKKGKTHETNYDVTDSLLIALYTFVKFNVCHKEAKRLLQLFHETKDQEFKVEFLEVSNTLMGETASTMDDAQKVVHLIENYGTARDYLFTKFKKTLQKEYSKVFKLKESE